MKSAPQSTSDRLQKLRDGIKLSKKQKALLTYLQTHNDASIDEADSVMKTRSKQRRSDQLKPLLDNRMIARHEHSAKNVTFTLLPYGLFALGASLEDVAALHRSPKKTHPRRSSKLDRVVKALAHGPLPITDVECTAKVGKSLLYDAPGVVSSRGFNTDGDPVLGRLEPGFALDARYGQDFEQALNDNCAPSAAALARAEDYIDTIESGDPDTLFEKVGKPEFLRKLKELGLDLDAIGLDVETALVLANDANITRATTRADGLEWRRCGGQDCPTRLWTKQNGRCPSCEGANQRAISNQRAVAARTLNAQRTEAVEKRRLENELQNLKVRAQR